MPEETKTVRASAEVSRERRRRFRRTRARELKMIAKALASTKHPILVHIIPMRRCNLDCGYCNEYDNVSKPVPLEEMKKRLDILADMGTSIITISGGEPLMHPELEEVIRHIRKRGMIAGMITNGFLLSKERIGTLNEAGLEHLQISIDNLVPDEVSKKSLKTLDIRLQWLAELAVFQVNINSVLGSGVKDPEDALKIAHRAVELGFTSTVGIIHDGNGQLKPLGPRELEIFRRSHDAGEAVVFAIQRFSAQRGARQRARLALPFGSSVFVHLRGRAGALVLAAARLSGDSASAVYGSDAPSRILHGEKLRADVYRLVRAAGGDYRQLARPANAKAKAHGASFAAAGASPNRQCTKRFVN
jgi:uncharacterized Fe-S cluster-containing radical SAM superfamily enzyme